MLVFKTFYKILWKQKGQLIMYICLFIMLSSIMASQGAKDSEITFEASKCDVAVFDYDDSAISKAISGYITGINNEVDIEDEKEIIQDELYNRNIECAIRIPKGYSTMLKENKTDSLEVITIPGTLKASTIESELNTYIKVLRSYTEAGYDEKDAIKAADKSIDTKVDINMLNSDNKTSHSKLFYSYIFIAYIFIVVLIVCVGPIIIVFNKKNVRERIMCSSYKLKKSNIELILGMITTGIGICALFNLFIIIKNGKSAFSMSGLLLTVNMLCFCAVALGITFFVSQFVNNVSSLSMISNIIGLGCSFLCGVFVPMELLGENVIRIAHVLPSYWYVVAADEADHYSQGDVKTYLGYIAIELAYAIVLFTAAAIATKLRRKKN